MLLLIVDEFLMLDLLTDVDDDLPNILSTHDELERFIYLWK